MGSFQDLTGNKYGYLTVIKRLPNKNKKTMWLCRCDCGKEKEVEAYDLKKYPNISCGCKKDFGLVDLTGKRFGRIFVVSRSENNGKKTMWNCLCDCGNKKKIYGKSLKDGLVVSCGCFHKEIIKTINKTHGDTGTKLHRAWQNMRARCYRKSSREYENYGGRGITVCEEWMESYENFKEWALSSGYDENLTLDREDVNGNYCPENCRWITNKEQQNNKRNNVLYEYNGQTKTLAQWSDEIGICYKTLQKRIRNWGVEKAFSTPLRNRNEGEKIC